MSPADITATAEKLIAAIAQLVPVVLENPAEQQKSKGVVAVMIVAGDGQVFGRMFGADPIRRRTIGQTAWRKASQVWITGHATGRYEEQVYAKKIDPDRFGIALPDLIGWDGGLPVVSADGTKFAVGMSGFTGAADCAIIRDAVALVPELKLAE